MNFLTYEDLSALLNMRAPLLMLDRLTVDLDNGTAEGIKMTSMDECHFAGHFPEQPVLPGVLQVACMFQAASAMFKLEGLCPEGSYPNLTALKRIKFRSPVRPGMVVQVQCSKTTVNEDGSVDYTVKNTADGQLASSGTITVAATSASYFEPVLDSGDSPVLAAVEGRPQIDVVEIMKYIPHRYPFLFVDRAFGFENIGEVYGFKNITGNGQFVNASTPAHFPGYLQIEAAAQLGCAAVLSQPTERGKIAFFMSIDTATFHCPVLPGEQLTFNLSCEFKGRFGIATGKLYAAGRLATEAAIKFAVLSPEEAAGEKQG